MWEPIIPPKMGRPPLYNTAEELHDKITEYFEEGCLVTRRDHMGIEYEDRVPTITGMVLYLGYSTLEAFTYQGTRDEDFLRVVKGAKTVVASYHEQKVASGDGWTGNLFWLKCQDKWVEARPEEKQETHHKYEITVSR